MTAKRRTRALLAVIAVTTDVSALATVVALIQRDRAFAQPPMAVSIAVDASQPRQVMTGFGATHNPLFYDGSGDALGPELRPNAIEAVYGEVRLNTGNLEAALLESPGSYDQRANDNGDPFSTNWSGFQDSRMAAMKSKILDIAEPLGFTDAFLAQKVNVRWASPWLATIRSADYDRYLDEVAEQVVAGQIRWRDRYGQVGRYQMLFNEPLSGNGELLNGSRQEVVDIVKRAGARLRAAGFGEIKFVVPNEETEEKSLDTAAAIMADPEARQYVGAIGYHTYPYGSTYSSVPNILKTSGAGRPDAARIAIRGRLRDLSKQYAVPLWMTEVSHGDVDPRSFDDLRGRAIHIHDELVHADASAYFGMNNMWDTVSQQGHFGNRNLYSNEGEPVLVDTDAKKVVITGMGHAIGHYARWIRPGAVRLEASSSDPLLLLTAFKDDAQGRLVLVVVNNSAAEVNAAVQISGLQIKTDSGATFFDGEMSTAAQSWGPLLPQPAQNGAPDAVRVLVAPLSVTTFSLRLAGSAPSQQTPTAPPTATSASSSATPHGAQTATSTPHGAHDPTATSTPHDSHTSTPTPHDPHDPTATSTPHDSHTATSTPHGAHDPTATSTPHDSHTATPTPHDPHDPTATPHGAQTATPTPHGAHDPTATPHDSHTATSTPHGAHDPTATPHGAQTATPTPHGAHDPTATPHDGHPATSTPDEHGTPMPTHTIAPTLVLTAVPTPTPTMAGDVPLYTVYERSFAYNADALANPWRDASLHVALVRPDGGTTTIRGFFYQPGEWRFRFMPDALGSWRWTATLRGGLDPAGPILNTWTGAFTAVPSSEQGPLRIGSANPARLVYASGQSFPAIGIGDCVLDGDNSGTPHDNNWGFDGDFRPQGHNGPGAKFTDLGTYARAYGREGAGFTLFRWSVDNCSFKLWETIAPGANRYLVREGKWGDEMVDTFRANGIRTYMAIFGAPPFATGATAEQMSAIGEYVDYVVARYGAMVDVWELMNESSVGNAWITQVAWMLRAADPYAHPISTSWEKPDHPAISITSPHWYEKEDELRSDDATRARIAELLRPGKPVIFGEQGNSVKNWDERSAVRMRLRSWSALFNGGALIFWNSSYAKDNGGGAANLYIGPEERGYIRALQAFASGVGAGATPFEPVTSAPRTSIRAYGLGDAGEVNLYLVHADNHDQTVTTDVTIDVPFEGQGAWTDPGTGTVLARAKLQPGRTTFPAPSFVVDVAFAMRRAGQGLLYLPWVNGQ